MSLIATAKMTRIAAETRVEAHNQKLKDYHESWLEAHNHPDTINFGDWMNYNEGRAPLIREGADLVHTLHKHGYTNYKINMQSGEIIK